jgi:hypothetical protein
MKNEYDILEACYNQYGHEPSDTEVYAFKDGAKWMQTQDSWISVVDGMPRQGQKCLIFNSTSVEPSLYDRDEFYRYPNNVEGDRCSLYYYEKATITHWMPLPEPPTT